MANEEATQPEPENEPISFADFLETSPPGQYLQVIDVAEAHTTLNGSQSYSLASPQLRLHCGRSDCGGIRVFRATVSRFAFEVDRFVNYYAKYYCSNCQQSSKIYSLSCKLFGKGSLNGIAYKFGEKPAFGPPTPSRLITLIGGDREVFLKGTQSENQGLGIGAFAYYRRVVENQKNRIIDQIIRAARKLPNTSEVISALESAKQETQFSKAVENIKPALPVTLLVSGHNPLMLLHRALSEGLHAQSDEQCLEFAHTIRVVLAALAEKISLVLKDERELQDAVSRLLKNST